MFEKVSSDAEFIENERRILRFWRERRIFDQLRAKNAGKPRWSFLDGPITANNPMGVHHAWGRTYKDAFQRYWAMMGRDQRFQNGFDCQGLWVEVEVEKELGFQTKQGIAEYGIDRFVRACKARVLKYAARQTEQSIRLGYWMDWDDPAELRALGNAVLAGGEAVLRTPRGATVRGPAEELAGRLGNPEWGGSYFTFSTENNETIWTFLKKCHTRGKIYRGTDVMPWSGRSGSAYSQMEVAEGRKLAVHSSCFVRFPLRGRDNEYLLVWTTTPWTLTSNVAAAVNPQMEYVKLRAKRDGAAYYLARENLEFPRLAREFKEGFGRPEWGWPAGVPKLKTIAQIFKEQGGYEVEATLPGAAMIGWTYRGPFDDLPAQNVPGGNLASAGGTPGGAPGPTAVACHRVVDGGRDAEGKPMVVAGEGTGIVHVAPGCGDVDHVLGRALGLVDVAPLAEDGAFLPGFGPFTGRKAIDKSTAQLVFDELRRNGMLVAVEEYPHIYPHCWRTGEELVFRVVDEWFIKMDWRDEIMQAAKQIRWLPESIDGLARELEWLTNMRDWMISKKRFWGLALPIWVDPETGEFEVVGSLQELQSRAVEGWNEFAGHTPHRPWIDQVKIRNPKTGNLMARIPDVGNPWLDAGIVSLSTMHYNTDRSEWRKWFPADLITECFPGQFRNWFYSLLSMAAMMEGSPPTKTVHGYRLVMNEDGQPMHKSDGTAIWFEEAAEQIGVDTMRWMYLAANPAVDLRFGRRYPDQPVTLEFEGGPATTTAEGAPLCKVVSKPADEIRRQCLIPLWHSYGFLVNYARLDGFDPRLPAVPVAERPEIDRWILACLQEVAAAAHAGFQAYEPAVLLKEAARFLDDLSNWYIRRNRRRFWRARDAADLDKLAAYQTLYHVLVTLTKLLAPVIPFLTERIYGNLVRRVDPQAPESVHLCDYPAVDAALRDPGLIERMRYAQTAVNLGHGLREKANRRVRQPLAELRFACRTAAQREALQSLAAVVADELNVKQITACDNLDDLVAYQYKPNLKTLGPKYGKALGALSKALPALPAAQLDPLRRGESVTLTVDGAEYRLAPEDVLVSTQQAADWASADDGGIQIALATRLTPELIQEGIARDFVRQVQQLRKNAELEIEDRIRIFFAEPSDEALAAAVAAWEATIRQETQADSLTRAARAEAGAAAADVGDGRMAIWIAKV